MADSTAVFKRIFTHAIMIQLTSIMTYIAKGRAYKHALVFFYHLAN